MSWFEQWTYAEFPSDDILVLALNTGQPWDSWGSHGSRQGFVMVLELADESRWELVAFEWGLDTRAHDEDFVPDAVVWHRRGVLAWLYDGDLEWHIRRRPREPVAADNPIYLNDIDQNLDVTDRTGELCKAGSHLTLDEEGRVLSVRSADSTTLLIDVDLDAQSADGHTWEPIPEGLVYHH